jgi:hypothetical protein
MSKFISYSIQYYVVGKTYSKGDKPHQINLFFEAFKNIDDYGVLPIELILPLVQSWLNKRYGTHDNYIFVTVINNDTFYKENDNNNTNPKTK